MPKPLEDRFWSKINRDGPIPPHRPDLGPCWVWTAATVFGYGVLQRGRRGEGVVRAPRLSWEIEHGPIPDGLIVCHHCDNPTCVRPTHLFLGTHGTNAADRNAKGRTQHYRAEWTHCPKGHEFDDANTYRTPDGRRQCRRCKSKKEVSHP